MTRNLIIGGGPAGAMLGALLARRGEDAAILERTDGPHHKVCGEFLSWEGASLLRDVGVDLSALAPAPIDRLRIVSGERAGETRLPGTALGISRYRLDEAPLAFAAEAGAAVRRGVDVREVDRESARLAKGETVSAERLWIATGKRDLRGAARYVRHQNVTAALTGFKLHLRLSALDRARIDRTIELHHFHGGYAGLQPIEGGAANLCLLIDTARLSSGWDDVTAHLERCAPKLARQIAAAEPMMARPLAISRVPYGFVARAGEHRRVGDQLAVIHSFTGDGLSLALTSGIMAANLATLAPQDLTRTLASAVDGPVRRAAFLYRLLSGGGVPLGLAISAPALARIAARLTRMPRIDVVKMSRVSRV